MTMSWACMFVLPSLLPAVYTRSQHSRIRLDSILLYGFLQ